MRIEVDKTEFVRLWRRGHTMREIADKLKLTPGQVAGYWYRWGLSDNRYMSEEAIARLVEQRLPVRDHRLERRARRLAQVVADTSSGPSRNPAK